LTHTKLNVFYYFDFAEFNIPPKGLYSHYLSCRIGRLSGVIKSYEVVFTGVERPTAAEILAKAAFREGKEFKIQIKPEFDEKCIRVLLKNGEKGEKTRRWKSVFIVKAKNAGNLIYKIPKNRECAVILDYPGKEFHEMSFSSMLVRGLNATKIAEELLCGDEFPMLGALAKTGFISLQSIIAAIYKTFDKFEAHKNAVAVKRGFDNFKW